MTGPRLALGTVQFGLAYGVQGSSAPVAPDEVRAILRHAWDLGIDRLDTAPGYGDIEQRLANLAGDLEFSIVSKIAADAGDGAAVRAVIATSRSRLGARLAGILFHAADRLTGPNAEELWTAASESGLPIGPSCYDAATLATIADRFPVSMAQVPGNAFDQAVGTLTVARPIEITVRSLFLQGLLLMPQQAAVARLPAARDALDRFHRFCAARGTSPLVTALGIARAFPGVDYCVVGVDSLAQLDEIARAWDETRPISASELDVRDTAVIDPRRWQVLTDA